MKILIISDLCPPENIGGAGNIAYNLFHGLKKTNHEIFVLTTTQNKNKILTGKENIYRIYVPEYHKRWRSFKSLFKLKSVSQAKKIIKNIRPDVIHIHNIHDYLSYGIFKISKKLCAKVFLTTHDVDLFHQGKLKEFVHQNNLSIQQGFNYKINAWQQLKRYKRRFNPLRRVIINYYLKYIDKIFAVSNALKNALNQNDIKNIFLIHNGINIDDWQASLDEIEKTKNKFDLHNKKIILFGGRFSGLKGGGNIVDVAEKVAKEVTNVVLLFIGKTGTESDKILKIVNEKKVKIVFTGWVSGLEKVAVFWSSNVFILPSFYLDPFPTQNLEAMACKKPVIATCFGGSKEVVEDNKTGFIVNPYNTEILAEKIIDLLKNPKKAEQMGESGFQRVKNNFSLEKQVNEYLKYYEG